jgi:hypothetical protein
MWRKALKSGCECQTHSYTRPLHHCRAQCLEPLSQDAFTLGTFCIELVFYTCSELSGTVSRDIKLCSVQISCHIHVQDKVPAIVRRAKTFCVLELVHGMAEKTVTIYIFISMELCMIPSSRLFLNQIPPRCLETRSIRKPFLSFL